MAPSVVGFFFEISKDDDGDFGLLRSSHCSLPQLAWGKKILNLNLVELKKNDFAKKSFKNTYLYQKLSGSFKSYVL